VLVAASWALRPESRRLSAPAASPAAEPASPALVPAGAVAH